MIQAVLPTTSPDVDVRLSDAVKLLRSLAPGSVRAIVADPPYGIAYHSNYYVGKNPHAPVANDWNFEPNTFFDAASDALCDGGSAWVFTRWDVFPIWAGLIPPTLVLKNAIVWVKDNWSAGDLVGNFGMQHEIVMFLTKGRFERLGHRYPNVWPFPRVPAKKLRHPTEKPVALVARIVEVSASAGDIIVDPYCGSGTLGEAAQAVPGVRTILGDVDPRQIRITCDRLGLPVPTDLPEEATAKAPPCPVFRVVPPDPSLWGIHPDDLAFFRTGHSK